MTNTIFNYNLLDTNNLIFVGLVLSSSIGGYFLGYSLYLGYKYYTDVSSPQGMNDSGINTPLNSEIESGSATPTGLIPSYRDIILKWRYKYRSTKDTSVQTDNLLTDASIQTDDQLSMDYFNELAMEIQTDTRLSVSTSFVGSPITPGTKISNFLNSFPSLSTDVGVQTNSDLLELASLII